MSAIDEMQRLLDDVRRGAHKKYRVNVIVSNYPSGKIVEEKEVDFDDYDKALKYADENNWINPMQTSKAVILKRQMSWVAMRDGEVEIPEE